MKAVLPFAPSASAAPENEALADAPPAVVAVVAAAAPDAGAPSRAILSAALLRIEAERKNGKTARLRTVMAWSGWAAAAGLTVWLGSGGDLSFSKGASTHRDGRGLSQNPDAPGGVDGGPILQGAAPGAHPAEDPAFPRERRIRGGSSAKRNATSVAAVQDMEQLRADLEKLRSTNEARFLSSPGLSRTVVVEMTDPSNPREAERLGAMRLSERVAESIAAGVTGAAEEKPADPPAKTEDGGKKDGSAPDTDSPEPKPPEKQEEPKQDLILSGGDGSWSGDVVIEKGLPNTGVLTLPEGAQIRHLDFPVDDAANYRGLLDLGAGYYYDQYSDLLWKPTGQGRAYTGEKAPAGFDAESFIPPGGGSTPAPEPEVPAQPDTSIPAETVTHPAVDTATNPPETAIPTTTETPAAEAVTAPPVRGYPIFDETTGSGSIILQNLPAAADGQSYQLWITDPASPQPVSVGIIPSLEEGGGRVWFDLGGPGVAPSGYLLTLEPGAGSKSPTGRVVLQGP